MGSSHALVTLQRILCHACTCTFHHAAAAVAAAIAITQAKMQGKVIQPVLPVLILVLQTPSPSTPLILHLALLALLALLRRHHLLHRQVKRLLGYGLANLTGGLPRKLPRGGGGCGGCGCGGCG
jgi:hypothetical protein